MKKLFISIIALTSTLLASCVKESFTDGYSHSIDLPINISATYPVSGSQTRATDNGFVVEDEVGIFVVDYNEDGSPGELASIGVRAANTPFVFNGGSWISPYQIYWGRSTPADIYGYYPYDSGLNTPTAYSFTVSSFQDAVDVNTTSGAGYERSDLLWAKAEKVYPTTEVINLRYKHLMAGVTISLEKGSGFTDVEWGNATKRVVIGNTKLSGTINLQDGSVEVVDNTVKNITPLAYNDVWRAVVMPQTVEAGEPLIIVEVDGQSYSLIKDESMTYNSGKMHNFTLLVNKKTATGDYEFKELASDVTPWIDDPDLHDGIVRQYIVVDVQTPGTLASLLADMGYKYRKITALKVTGFINYDDLEFMGKELTSLEALNLRDVKIEAKKTAWGYIQREEDMIGGLGYNLDNDWNNNDDEHGPLKFLILPSSLKKIASGAFLSQSLMGTIEIPEGVEYIGEEAFGWNYLSGSVKLPSSLKILGDNAFYHNLAMSGQLHLPEGLEAIGESDTYRGGGRPIFYTRNVQNATNAFDSFATKTKRDQTKYIDGAPEADLLECVKPLPTEMIIPKSYASAFYGTPLQSYLVKLGIDTVIIVGGSTSGCCRATAVDAVTRNYNLGYVEDCLFDRISISHKAALLDVWMKYGDVINSDYVKEYFYSLKEDK